MPEVYREKFRSIKKDNTVTFTLVAFRLETSFKRWIRSLNVTKFDELKQVVLIEQYMSCLPDDIRIWLLDRNPTTLSDAAKLSDEYTAVHKNHASLLPKTSFIAVTGHSDNNRFYNSNRRYQGYRRSGRFGFNSTRGVYSSNDARTESAVGQDNVTHSQFNNQQQGCWFCGKRGHKKSQYRAFKAQNVSNNHGHEESNINANNKALSRSHNH